MEVERLIRRAQDGDREALGEVVAAIQDPVYRLALRTLADPDEAQDATQEILVRIVTKLSTFQFRSAFRTWVFRVATNYLLDTRRRSAREPVLTFAAFRDDLESDLQAPGAWAEAAEYPLLLNEVRIGCTMAMLLCLDRPHRLAYILGDIFELDHQEASAALGIQPASYRKRLSRARAKVLAFTRQSCGLVTETAACACDRKLTGALGRRRVDPRRLRLASASAESYETVRARLRETTAELRTLSLQTAVPRFGSPTDFSALVEELVDAAAAR